MAPVYGERWTVGCKDCHHRGRRVLLGWITWTGPAPIFNRYATSKGAATHAVVWDRTDTTVRCRKCKKTSPIRSPNLRDALQRHSGEWDEDVLI